MKKSKQSRCLATNREYAICQTAQALLPSFVMSGADKPESVLGNYPNPTPVIEALKTLIDVMFPGKMSAGPVSADELGIFMVRRLSEAWRLLRPEIERALPFRWTGAAARTEHRKAQPKHAHAEASRAMDAFFQRLPHVRTMLVEDVRAAYEGDPAALTFAEVQLAYPGLLAIASHRLAHELYRLDVPIVPRIMSEWTHAQTGIDINPGAQIGHGFFIDHGTGVVIGETAKIGNRVKLYQGVTLGAKSFPLDKHGHPIKHVQRHPTVEDNVVIYSNASILGGDTVIGRGSTVGGNVFLMESVPPNSLVTGEHPELKVKQRSTE
jgi:serine O-acetyltransferase